MSKTIKFNLILDGHQVRSIEDLQENFCVEDVMSLYQDGLLQKWLKVRGYDKELQQVEAIKNKNPVIVELIKIFKIETKENVIKESLYSLEYWKERESELKKWEKTGGKVKKAIVDYHQGYETLISKVIEHQHDMAFMKATAKEISQNYHRLFHLNSTRFYLKFTRDAPLMIYAILMTNPLRDMLLKNADVSKSLIKTFMIKSKEEAVKLVSPDLADKIEKALANKTDRVARIGLWSYTVSSTQATSSNHKGATLKYFEVFDKIMQSIGLHIFTGDTQSYWKGLQTKDTKVMIISVPGSCRVRSANDKSEGIASQDANGKFLIFDGLDYQSSDTDKPIVYLEI